VIADGYRSPSVIGFHDALAAFAQDKAGPETTATLKNVGRERLADRFVLLSRDGNQFGGDVLDRHPLRRAVRYHTFNEHALVIGGASRSRHACDLTTAGMSSGSCFSSASRRPAGMVPTKNSFIPMGD